MCWVGSNSDLCEEDTQLLVLSGCEELCSAFWRAVKGSAVPFAGLSAERENKTKTHTTDLAAKKYLFCINFLPPCCPITSHVGP